jgi:hypothetical protein
MQLTKPDGTAWTLEDGASKLSRRSGLPGARVFDHCAESLRTAKRLGLSAVDRLPLALPASWCVNSPADSRVLRRWALPPQRDVWVALVDLLEEPGGGPHGGRRDAESREAILGAVASLGPEPFGVEAISKVLALLVPEAVPLMPEPALAFLLGGGPPRDAKAFLTVIEWFPAAVAEASDVLAGWAEAHPFSAAQVLDRLLWFDSDGHRIFAGRPAATGGVDRA